MWDLVRERLQRATLGHYVIEAELGRGGMAAVFLAHEIGLDRRVAIKVMSPSLLTGEGMIDRFRQEAMTVAKLNHPHIITIHSVRQDEDLHYFVMTYVEGRSVDRIIRDVGALSVPSIKAIVCQVASALHYAHRRGVVHRDIKPANIMLDDDGNAIVTDFGIARVTTGPHLTMTGGTLGTPAYMSPEQCNALELTGASDQYSLGVVAYELLTGAPPYSGPALTIMLAHTRESPRPPTEIRPDCPPELGDAVMRMLARDPSQRWPNMGAVVSAIGMPPLGEEDPVRLELSGLARTGEHERPRISVPVSPPVHTPMLRVPVASVVIEPGTASMSAGDSLQFAASGLDAAGTPLPDRRVRWTSSDPGVAAVSETGLLTAISAGQVDVVATVGDHTATARISVAATPLAELGLGGNDYLFGPPPADDSELVSIATSATMPLPAAIPTPEPSAGASDEAEASAAAPARWRVPRIDWRPAMRWLGSAAAAGRSGLRAIARLRPHIASLASRTLTSATELIRRVPSVSWRSGSTRVWVGSAAAGALTLLLWIGLGRGDSRPADAGSDVAIVPVDTQPALADTGNLQVPVPGDTLPIIDSAGATTGLPLAVSVTPALAEVVVGDTLHLAASVQGRAPTTPADSGMLWRSSDSTLATVSPGGIARRGGRPLVRGILRAVAPGTVRIVTSVDSVSDTISITVKPAAVAAVAVSPAETTIAMGAAIELRASTLDPNRRALANRLVVWQSSDTMVVRVDSATGRVTSGRPGVATVTASSENARGSVTITVTPPAGRLSIPARGIRAGQSMSCAFADAGLVTCWGGGRPVSAALPGGDALTDLALGRSHWCGLRGGQAFCWGDNRAGQLGTGSPRSESGPPVPVATDERFVSITAGDEHTCALTRSGAAYCWGSNSAGQLGDNTIQSRRIPVAVATTHNFTAISAGGDNTCAITTNGAAYCWGNGSAGAIGNGLRQDERVPQEVRGGPGFTTIHAGGQHTCALTADGRAYCWGWNNAGQLGDGSTRQRLVPVQVRAGGRLRELTVGRSHSCAVAGDSVVVCWGDNGEGQLGTGNRNRQSAPTPVVGEYRFSAVVAAGGHTCALTSRGETYCWGDNSRGQLGTGENADQSAPTRVIVRP